MLKYCTSGNECKAGNENEVIDTHILQFLYIVCMRTLLPAIAALLEAYNVNSSPGPLVAATVGPGQSPANNVWSGISIDATRLMDANITV